MKKIIGYAMEHVDKTTKEIDTRIVIENDDENIAKEELKATIENDMFPESGTWQLNPIFEDQSFKKGNKYAALVR